MKRCMVMALVLTISAGSPGWAQTPAGGSAEALPTWRIDTSHSELTFQVRHLLSRVRGSFGQWSGTLQVDPTDLDGGSVSVEIDASTIDTNNSRRDSDLRGEEFFDAESHPTITFRSESVGTDGRSLRVHGDLTMRGVTRPVTLEGEYLGSMRDGQGRDRVGFEAETTIDRHDFGITWNRVVEGGNLLGDEVTIVIAVQAVRQDQAND